VDLVVGPDAYRDLPNLLKETEDGRDAINVILSKKKLMQISIRFV
jgi:tRNA-2-methylthio-N6-dimethylallyladenosine synthase